MDSIGDAWPIILIVLAVGLLVLGLIRKLAKLVVIGIVAAVIGLVLWPIVNGSGA